jgi:hypothetical protein
MLKSPAPSVQDGQSPKFGPKALRITSDIQEGLRDGAKEQAVEHVRIVEDEWAEVPW